MNLHKATPLVTTITTTSPYSASDSSNRRPQKMGEMDDSDGFETDDGELEDEVEESGASPTEEEVDNEEEEEDRQSGSIPSDINDTSDDLRGLVGLQNLGNTCYINAALQALSNCQQLTRFVLERPAFFKDSGLSRCYRELINELWSSKNNSQYAVPASIIRTIKCIYPAFRGCTQQDTQEFLRCFLEQLHDELKQPKERNATEKSSSVKQMKQSKQPDTSSRASVNSANLSSPSSSASTSSNEVDGGDGAATNSHEPAIYPVHPNSCDSQQQQQQKQQQQTTTTPPQASKQEEQRSIISDTFEFRISSSIVCSSCNNISTTKETFKDLSVPIPSRDHPYYQRSTDNSTTTAAKTTTNDCSKSSTDDEETDGDEERAVASTPSGSQSYVLARWLLNWFSQLGNWFWGPQVTLHDCLSVFFGTDPLDGDNQYSCEVCTKKNKGFKYLKILELPEVLCIHFKRYESVGSAKITSHVAFPLVGLDLAPFMSPNSRSQCTTYNLIACICHHGSDILTGHYTTYALNCYDDQWYEFDDQYVTCVSSYQVENSEAYILFYQKAPHDHNYEDEVDNNTTTHYNDCDEDDELDKDSAIDR